MSLPPISFYPRLDELITDAQALVAGAILDDTAAAETELQAALEAADLAEKLKRLEAAREALDGPIQAATDRAFRTPISRGAARDRWGAKDSQHARLRSVELPRSAVDAALYEASRSAVS